MYGRLYSGDREMRPLILLPPAQVGPFRVGAAAIAPAARIVPSGQEVSLSRIRNLLRRANGGHVMASTYQIIHFALRATEPTRAACGSYARHFVVGEVDQDDISRRLQGQADTTCVSCRRVMLWDARARTRGGSHRGRADVRVGKAGRAREAAARPALLTIS
jgi:hypothetical protein